MVVGVGYMERERLSGGIDKHAADRLLNRSRLLRISEPDLHQLIAGVILAGAEGRDDRGETSATGAGGLTDGDPDIITGLQTLAAEAAGETF